MNNVQVRKLLNDYYKNSFQPNLKIVAQQIQVSYWHLLKFKNNKVDLSDKTLNKIIAFLDEQQKEA